MSLEKIFDNCSWDRKFEHHTPMQNIEFVWRKGEESEAEKTMSRLEEETDTHFRAICLGNDSLGQTLIITKEEWE